MSTLGSSVGSLQRSGGQWSSTAHLSGACLGARGGGVGLVSQWQPGLLLAPPWRDTVAMAGDPQSDRHSPGPPPP